MKNQEYIHKQTLIHHISFRFMPGDGNSINAVANLTARKEEIHVKRKHIFFLFIDRFFKFLF
jgi:hypothetical protein